MIDRFFGVARSGSSIRTEIIAGATTYLMMAYIVFANPVLLAEAGPSVIVLALLFIVKYAFF